MGLITASKEGQLDEVKALLAAGADLEARDEVGAGVGNEDSEVGRESIAGRVTGLT